MTDTNIKDVETQKPNGDNASTCSGVKTPLVDALRSYFDQPISGGPLRYDICQFQIEATDRG